MTGTEKKPEFELKLERVIDAPVARVWDAWSKPEQVSKWFAPKPLSLEIAKLDFRSGGTFQMSMVWPDGKQRHDFGGTYVEVVQGKKIVWTGEFPGDPKDNIRTEVVFTDLGEKTKLNVIQNFAVLTDVNRGPTQGANQGWGMTLDQLEAFVGPEIKTEDRREFTVKRRFDAPPEKVFEAWVDPEKARRWLFATPAGKIVRCDIDARPGGSFSIVDRRDGKDVEHVGEYKTVEPPRLLEFTFAVPELSAESTLVTVEIVRADPGCELTLHHRGVLP